MNITKKGRFIDISTASKEEEESFKIFNFFLKGRCGKEDKLLKSPETILRNMRILFTGGSSFTGMWFLKSLKEAGHTIVAPLRGAKDFYTGTRKQRVDQAVDYADIRFSHDFGSDAFDALIKNEPFDMFCHHAADVENYKSPDFDPVAALKNNVGNLKSILLNLSEKGCRHVLLTGSIFEQNEGAGSDGLRAVSPYGLSKGLTAEVFKYYCESQKMPLGKFVIPNPFGPFEEFRFTSFLMQNWFLGKSVHVSQPAYVRDNIHVSLLAQAYRDFVEKLGKSSAPCKLNPSGYPESQGAFTARFAEAMRMRLGLECAYTLAEKQDFLEPRVRLNSDLLDSDELGWSEGRAWDDLASYYESVYSPCVCK